MRPGPGFNVVIGPNGTGKFCHAERVTIRLAKWYLYMFILMAYGLIILSGKSTIVSAITLGLGGNHNSLGRQKNLSDFVNNASPDADATIEIELSKSDGDNHTVQSTISKSGGRNGKIR